MERSRRLVAPARIWPLQAPALVFVKPWVGQPTASRSRSQTLQCRAVRPPQARQHPDREDGDRDPYELSDELLVSDEVSRLGMHDAPRMAIMMNRNPMTR